MNARVSVEFANYLKYLQVALSISNFNKKEGQFNKNIDFISPKGFLVLVCSK